MEVYAQGTAGSVLQAMLVLTGGASDESTRAAGELGASRAAKPKKRRLLEKDEEGKREEGRTTDGGVISPRLGTPFLIVFACCGPPPVTAALLQCSSLFVYAVTKGSFLLPKQGKRSGLRPCSPGQGCTLRGAGTTSQQTWQRERGCGRIRSGRAREGTPSRWRRKQWCGGVSHIFSALSPAAEPPLRAPDAPHTPHNRCRKVPLLLCLSLSGRPRLPLFPAQAEAAEAHLASARARRSALPSGAAGMFLQAVPTGIFLKARAECRTRHPIPTHPALPFGGGRRRVRLVTSISRISVVM